MSKWRWANEGADYKWVILSASVVDLIQNLEWNDQYSIGLAISPVDLDTIRLDTIRVEEDGNA